MNTRTRRRRRTPRRSPRGSARSCAETLAVPAHAVAGGLEVEADLGGGVEGVRAGCVAAVGIPSERSGTEIVVVAETKAAAAEHPQLARRVREALRLRGIAVDRVALVAPGEIPRTTSGKVRRREVARTLAQALARQ